MAINTDNDKVQVYQGGDELWYWRRVDTSNGKVVAIGGEGYVTREYTNQAAEAYNPGVDVVPE